MPYRPFGQNCSIARTLEVVGERWTLLIVREVLLGRRRFDDLRTQTGVATNILSDRLETLVAHGVIERTEAGEYRATEAGRELTPVLLALMEWGDRHRPEGDGPPRVAVHTACGHDAHPDLRCSHCGESLPPGEVRMRPGPGANERQLADGVLPVGR